MKLSRKEKDRIRNWSDLERKIASDALLSKLLGPALEFIVGLSPMRTSIREVPVGDPENPDTMSYTRRAFTVYLTDGHIADFRSNQGGLWEYILSFYTVEPIVPRPALLQGREFANELKMHLLPKIWPAKAA